MTKSPYDAYRHVQANTGSGADLVLMLFRGALRFLDRAQANIEADNVQDAHNALIRAQDIISELNTSLDHERGTDLASGLESIYTYAIERLIEANLRKQIEPVQEVRRLIAELATAWEDAIGASRTRPEPLDLSK
jgi:flagellar secretion chaperone FliS